MAYMTSNDWSDIQRDLALMKLQLLHIQSEQQKRQEELDAIERDLAKHRDYLNIITSPEFIKLINDPIVRKKMKAIARIWKNRFTNYSSDKRTLF